MISPRLFLRRAAEYLYPARCVSCRGALRGSAKTEHSENDAIDGVRHRVLCDRCYDEFAESCRTACRHCGRKYSECECVPDSLRDVGVRRAFSCFRYDKSKHESVSSRFLFSLKHTERFDSIAFAAELLAARIRSSGILPDTVITYAPRCQKNIRRYGGDHMKMTAKLLSQILGCEYADAFVNHSRGEQKYKDVAARGAASLSYSLRRGVDLSGRRVIIIDDIITSGYTMSKCADLARRAGASEVLVLVLSKSR